MGYLTKNTVARRAVGQPGGPFECRLSRTLILARSRARPSRSLAVTVSLVSRRRSRRFETDAKRNTGRRDGHAVPSVISRPPTVADVREAFVRVDCWPRARVCARDEVVRDTGNCRHAEVTLSNPPPCPPVFERVFRAVPSVFLIFSDRRLGFSFSFFFFFFDFRSDSRAKVYANFSYVCRRRPIARHAVRAAGRRARPPEPRQVARRVRQADRGGPRAGRRHQLRAEQRAAADGLGGRARGRGVPRAPRPADGRGHQIGQPQEPRPGARRHRRSRRPESRHSP